MLKKTTLLCLFLILSVLASPARADICDYVPEDEAERDEFYGLNPFCENIDEHIPLDDGLPFLIAGGVVIGLVFRRQLNRQATG